MVTRDEQEMPPSAVGDEYRVIEEPQVELGDVDEAGQRGVSGVHHLEAAIEPEAVNAVGHDPAAEPGSGFEDQHLKSGGREVPGRGQPGRPAADDDDVTAARQVGHHITIPR